MSKKLSETSAFPCPTNAQMNGYYGMTYREWLAGIILAGMRANSCQNLSGRNGNLQDSNESFAMCAKEQADALIKLLDQ